MLCVRSICYPLNLSLRSIYSSLGTIASRISSVRNCCHLEGSLARRTLPPWQPSRTLMRLSKRRTYMAANILPVYWLNVSGRLRVYPVTDAERIVSIYFPWERCDYSRSWKALQDDVVPLKFPITKPDGSKITELHIRKGDASVLLNLIPGRTNDLHPYRVWSFPSSVQIVWTLCGVTVILSDQNDGSMKSHFHQRIRWLKVGPIS